MPSLTLSMKSCSYTVRVPPPPPPLRPSPSPYSYSPPPNCAVHQSNSPFSYSLFHCSRPAVPGPLFCVCSVTMVMKFFPKRLGVCVCVLRGRFGVHLLRCQLTPLLFGIVCACCWRCGVSPQRRMCKRTMSQFLPHFFVYFLKFIMADTFWSRSIYFVFHLDLI